MAQALAFIVLSEKGSELARRLQAQIPGSIVYGLTTRVTHCDVPIMEVAETIRRLFSSGTPIIGICAAGILIRAIAPLLHNKADEPPVLAIAEDGSAIVPLLGGHQGGNRLARRLAEICESTAAITTAGEITHGFSLDDLPEGWRFADPEATKTNVLAAALRDDLRIEGPHHWLPAPLPQNPKGKHCLLISEKHFTEKDTTTTILHPPILTLGVGCARDTDPEELRNLVRATLSAFGFSEGAIAAVVSINVKADEGAVHRLAETLKVPARFFDAETLEKETPRLLNPSDVVFQEVGCHGVAEAAALAAAGPDSQLVIPKQKSQHCTMAVALATRPLDPVSIGYPQGQLSIIGIGPGTALWRTPEATLALAEAEEIVGYGLYLDLIRPLISGKPQHETALGEEALRVDKALTLAATGRRVALVSSGDAGIYGLATLVFERLAQENRPEWNRLCIHVLPGVSAMQAAAARIGAPLGHDFCVISLSDLLTPWDIIAHRLEAAATADFVVALYNPRSQRRQGRFAAAQAILLNARTAATPVILARNLGRSDEKILVRSLGTLDPEEVDMLTLVLIGSSATKHLQLGQHDFVYTPRGYSNKTS
ncbi:MAG: precorrin-3B C(17)-methyltransferase [Alphaproteobacteria bacterium]